jgi:hypothetical protein
VLGATYDFKLVSLGRIYEFRDDLELPGLLNYLIGITSGALLPFAFACLVMRRNYRSASIALVLLLVFIRLR